MALSWVSPPFSLQIVDLPAFVVVYHHREGAAPGVLVQRRVVRHILVPLVFALQPMDRRQGFYYRPAGRCRHIKGRVYHLHLQCPGFVLIAVIVVDLYSVRLFHDSALHLFYGPIQCLELLAYLTLAVQLEPMLDIHYLVGAAAKGSAVNQFVLDVPNQSVEAFDYRLNVFTFGEVLDVVEVFASFVVVVLIIEIIFSSSISKG